MRQSIGPVIGSESGVALVIALITIVVMLLVSVALVAAAMTETLSVQAGEDSARAFYVAEAAASRAVASLRLDTDWTTDGTGIDATGRCGTDAGRPVLFDLMSGRCMGPTDYPEGMPYPTWEDPVGVAPGGGSGGGGGTGRCIDSSTPGGPGAVPSPNPPAAVPPGNPRFIVTYETTGRSKDRINLRVIGRVGRATRGFTFTAHRLYPADFAVYSSTSVNAQVSGNGTWRIRGSVYMRQDWLFHGNSFQLNDRPLNVGETEPYRNQTFICGNLDLNGNPKLGTSTQPMEGVHIGGRIIISGNQPYDCGTPGPEICTRFMDDKVPDIQLEDVGSFVDGLKANRTNALTSDGTRLRMFRYSGSGWTAADNANLDFGADALRLPKIGREADCQSAPGHPSPNRAQLQTILQSCAAYYMGYNVSTGLRGVLFVAAGQRIYVPGKVSMGNSRDVFYQVDDNPNLDAASTAGESEGDASIIAVGCEGCTNPALDVSEMIRSRSAAGVCTSTSNSNRFPRLDALAFAVKGSVTFGLNGNAASQELQGSFIARNSIRLTKDAQIYGQVIANALEFEQNVDLCQVAGLKDFLPAAVGTFLEGGKPSVIITNWREIL
ncbi:MAG: hypothetical protein QN163_05940 [Armatimonadota bacterium]|nr:hypothetical protein [Armatimonadota bacterium]